MRRIGSLTAKAAAEQPGSATSAIVSVLRYARDGGGGVCPDLHACGDFGIEGDVGSIDLHNVGRVLLMELYVLTRSNLQTFNDMQL